MNDAIHDNVSQTEKNMTKIEWFFFHLAFI